MERLIEIYFGIALIRMGYNQFKWHILTSEREKYNVNRQTKQNCYGLGMVPVLIITDIFWIGLAILWVGDSVKGWRK